MRPVVYIGDHTALAMTRFGDKIYVDSRDTSLAPHIMLQGDWEPWVTNAFIAKLTELREPTVIDVGANVGWYTLVACRFGAKRVVAFEPNVRLAELVGRSIHVNGYGHIASVRSVACGSERQSRVLGVNPLELGGAHLLPPEEEGGYTVSVTRLDDELPPSTLTGPVVIKIDVEGFEPDVVTGAWDIITEHRPNLFVEHHQTERNLNLLRLLFSNGYKLLHCRHSGFASAPLSVEEAGELGDAEMILCEP